MKLSKAMRYLQKNIEKPGSVPIKRLNMAQALGILAMKDMLQRIGDLDA